MEDGLVVKAQVFLRLLSVVLLVSTACIVAFDSETKIFLSGFEKKATTKDLNSLGVLVIIASIAAGYQFLQLIYGFIFAANKNEFGLNRAWLSMFFDQMVAYISFASNSVVAQDSLIALTGVKDLQWLKLCNTYTRFCIQMGGGLICGYAGSAIMMVVSIISAFTLLRFYSSTHFLVLKQR